MKTIITLCIALAVSICTAQEKTEKHSKFFTSEQVEQLQETLERLSDKLEKLEISGISTAEIEDIKVAFNNANDSIVRKVRFFKTFEKKTSPTSNVRLKYSITYDKDKDEKTLADINPEDFDTFKEAMKDFFDAMETSPKIKEFEIKLQQLQEKLENVKKD